MSKQIKWILAAAAFVLVLVGGTVLYNRISLSRSPQERLQMGGETVDVEPGSGSGQEENHIPEDDKMMAPDFTVVDSDGNEVKLSDLFGKPIVLNFWASWCPPCKSEMPEFDSVYQEMGDEVTFVMVDLVGGRETKEQGEAYIAEQGYSFPVYYDVNQEAGNTYGIASIPTSIFIDRNGYIITGAMGAIDRETLLYGISFILEEQA